MTAVHITSVWSAYGHAFMPTDSPEHESCLTCGAMYQLRADDDDPTHGEYLTASGGIPAHCTRDTERAHGYPGERYCHEHQHPRDYSDHECSHVAHDCPCILCDS